MKNLAKKSSNENLVELISILGVGIIGFGLGALLAGYVKQFVAWILLLGILMHSWGMYKLRFKYKEPRYRILYWICWIILIGLLFYLITMT